jgi:hypothetical protein
MLDVDKHLRETFDVLFGPRPPIVEALGWRTGDGLWWWTAFYCLRYAARFASEHVHHLASVRRRGWSRPSPLGRAIRCGTEKWVRAMMESLAMAWS